MTAEVKDMTPPATHGLYNMKYQSVYGSDVFTHNIVATSYAQAEAKFHKKFVNMYIMVITYRGVVSL